MTSPGDIDAGVGRMTRLEYLERHLAELHDDIDLAREAESYTAMASLYNSARQLAKELFLERERLAGGDPEADMSDDELLVIVLEAIQTFSATAPVFFDRVCDHVDQLQAGTLPDPNLGDSGG